MPNPLGPGTLSDRLKSLDLLKSQAAWQRLAGKQSMESFNPSHDHAHDEASIRAVEAAYDAAWHDRNLEALVACLTEDAVLVNPFGDVARGRTQIRQMLGEVLAGPAKGSRHTSVVFRVGFITESVAIVDGQAMIEGLPPGGDWTTSRVTHRFTDVLVRENVAWKISQVRACPFVAEIPEDAVEV